MRRGQRASMPSCRLSFQVCAGKHKGLRFAHEALNEDVAHNASGSRQFPQQFSYKSNEQHYHTLLRRADCFCTLISAHLHSRALVYTRGLCSSSPQVKHLPHPYSAVSSLHNAPCWWGDMLTAQKGPRTGAMYRPNKFRSMEQANAAQQSRHWACCFWQNPAWQGQRPKLQGSARCFVVHKTPQDHAYRTCEPREKHVLTE